MRAILDLKWLDQFLVQCKFKMEMWCSIVASLDKGDMLSTADPSEAYLHITIHPAHRCFLRFCYGW